MLPHRSSHCMLPTEILAIIVAFSERNTLAKLALSNCRFKELAQPNLYQSIKFKYDEKIIDRIKQLFQTLASNASLASLVIRLSVTGNNRWNGGFMSTQESRQFIQLLAEGFAKMHNLSTIRFDGMAPFDGVFFQVINNATIKTFRTSLAMCPENFRWLSEQEHLEKLEVPCWFIRISKVATILDQERGCNVFKHLTSVRAPVVTVATIVAYGQPSLEAIYFTFDEPIENGPPDLNLNEIQAMFKRGVGPLKKLVFEFLVGERSVKTILEILGQYHGSTLETLSILMPYVPFNRNGSWDHVWGELKKLTRLRYLYLPAFENTTQQAVNLFSEMCHENCPSLIEFHGPREEGLEGPCSSDEE